MCLSVCVLSFCTHCSTRVKFKIQPKGIMSPLDERVLPGLGFSERGSVISDPEVAHVQLSLGRLSNGPVGSLQLH